MVLAFGLYIDQFHSNKTQSALQEQCTDTDKSERKIVLSETKCSKDASDSDDDTCSEKRKEK